MRVCSTNAQTHYPAVIWEVYDRPEAGGDENGYRRSLAAANDGGRWVFEQSGTPYSFEELDAYAAPRKKNRFTDEMLHRYLNELGIPPLNDSGFSGCEEANNILLMRPAHDNSAVMTLEEVLASSSC